MKSLAPPWTMNRESAGILTWLALEAIGSGRAQWERMGRTTHESSRPSWPCRPRNRAGWRAVPWPGTRPRPARWTSGPASSDTAVLLYRPENLDEVPVVGQAVAEHVDVRPLTVPAILRGANGNERKKDNGDGQKKLSSLHGTSCLRAASRWPCSARRGPLYLFLSLSKRIFPEYV